MGAFQLICLNKTSDHAFKKFQQLATQLVPFRDAGEEPSDFDCTVLDCLRGLEKAI